MNTSKEESYRLLFKQVSAVVDGEDDMIARMANTAAMLHETFAFWWTGFYRVVEQELVLGPFQGPVACSRIALGRGVCGSAWQQRRTLVVPDVEAFPGHIACSSESRSEIVVPILQDGQVVAVLDIDSQHLNTFDDTDARWLERIAALLVVPSHCRDLYLAAGCFWGAEHYLKLIRGVVFTEVGFANGTTVNPTYREVYTDTTGFAETVHLRYNPAEVSLQFLVEMYFKAIDPTSLNQQGEDRGTRYRTGIYYTDADDLPVIRSVVDTVARQYDRPLQVEIEPLRNFYRAEEEHQDYLANHPDGYCHLPVALFDLARATRS